MDKVPFEAVCSGQGKSLPLSKTKIRLQKVRQNMNYPFENNIKKTVSDNLNSVHASEDLILETLKRLQLEGLVADDSEEVSSSVNKRT